MFRNITLVVLIVLGASSCFMQKSSAKKKPKAPDYEYGDTHEQVRSIIKDRNEVMIAEFNMPEGHVVTYLYERFGKAKAKGDGFYLYFINDTLIRKSRPEDLEKGAKLAVKNWYYTPLK
jgi:hypothetical protein